MPKDVEFEEQQVFLELGVEKARSLSNSIDQQINILVGISSAIFVYSISQYIAKQSLVHLCLTLFMALTMLLGIVTIHPFRWMRRRGKNESVLYNHHVVKQPSAKEYAAVLTTVIQNRSLLVEQYAIEIYNTYKYYYRPKRDLYIQARNVFSFGIVVTVFIVALQMFYAK